MNTGVVFNLQRFAVHDGPGIRTTVFLQGCPLRCEWCHNPEGLEFDAVVAMLPHLCIGCASCVPVCSPGLARPLDGSGVPAHPRSDDSPSAHVGRSQRCLRCGACAQACPTGARVLMGERYSVRALMHELERDRVFYEESGGGVTFSGGEPLAAGNRGFLLHCLRACGERGLHRTVDTSGYVRTDALLEAAQHCDLFLFDLKMMDSRAHRRHTGAGNERILHNLEQLSRAGNELWIRIPLVPGVNDDAGNLDATVDFIQTLPRTHPVYLLPYHALGREKHARLERSDPLQDRAIDSMLDPEIAAKRFRRAGVEVHLGG